MDENVDVDFGSIKSIGYISVICGTAIAIGVPWVVLTNAVDAQIGGFATTLLSLIGVFGGVAMGITGVFFSIVIPGKIGIGTKQTTGE